MPKVSVCVQAYNHAPYISQALDSVLMQETDFDFEIIIGEDESTDGTREICIYYAEQHPDRIRLFLRSRKDVIYINGRATGRYNFIENLKAARGNYIALLDGDDYWTDPQKLQKQANLLDTHPEYTLCFHAVRHIDQYGNFICEVRPPGLKQVYTVEDLVTQNFITTLSVMFRKQLHDELPCWFWKTPVADWPLHVLNALRGDIGYSDEVMGNYRIHPQSYMSKVKKDPGSTHYLRIQTLELFRENLSGKIDETSLDAALGKAYTLLGDSYASAGNLTKARKAWREAVKLNRNNKVRAKMIVFYMGKMLYFNIRKLKWYCDKLTK